MTHSNTHSNDSANNEALCLEQLTSSGILTLTLNRPKEYNALSNAMLDALQHKIDNIDDSTRVIVIAANGPAFCAGHNLKEMRANIDEQWQRDLFSKCSHFMQSLIGLPIPVVARVQGVAAAAGAQLVANCDLAIASDQATFGVSGINLGLFCSTPAVALSRNISRKRAFQMLMSGDFIDADTAVQWGLINECVPAEQLESTTRELCEKLSAKSQVAVATGKKLFYQQIEEPLSAAYERASSTMACNMMANDASEGIDAFFEKRNAQWTDE